MYNLNDLSIILKINKNKIKHIINFINKIHNRQHTSINFLQLVEVYIINKLLENNIGYDIIENIYRTMMSKYKYDYPFSTNKFNQFIDNYIKSTNVNIIKDDISQKIIYDDQGIAKEFYPLTIKKYITVNPEIQAGEPTIKGTRIPIDIIYQMLQNEDDAVIKHLYNINDDIISAIKEFYNN